MNALSMLIGPIADLLKRLIPDANARAEAQEEIAKLLVQNESALLDAMKTVMAADAASEGWLTRNARPITVLWSLGLITIIVIEALTGGAVNVVNALRQVPSELWNLITVGTGAYMLLRSGEKIADTVANRPRTPAGGA